MKECDKMIISKYIDNELTDDVKIKLENHLDECSSCRETLDEYNKMARFMKTESRDVPGTLFSRIRGTEEIRRSLSKSLVLKLSFSFSLIVIFALSFGLSLIYGRSAFKTELDSAVSSGENIEKIFSETPEGSISHLLSE